MRSHHDCLYLLEWALEASKIVQILRSYTPVSQNISYTFESVKDNDQCLGAPFPLGFLHHSLHHFFSLPGVNIKILCAFPKYCKIYTSFFTPTRRKKYHKVMCEPCASCTCNSVLNYTLVFDVWSGDTT